MSQSIVAVLKIYLSPNYKSSHHAISTPTTTPPPPHACSNKLENTFFNKHVNLKPRDSGQTQQYVCKGYPVRNARARTYFFVLLQNISLVISLFFCYLKYNRFAIEIWVPRILKFTVYWTKYYLFYTHNSCLLYAFKNLSMFRKVDLPIAISTTLLPIILFTRQFHYLLRRAYSWPRHFLFDLLCIFLFFLISSPS